VRKPGASVANVTCQTTTKNEGAGAELRRMNHGSPAPSNLMAQDRRYEGRGAMGKRAHTQGKSAHTHGK
jgi:hypothetical protein